MFRCAKLLTGAHMVAAGGRPMFGSAKMNGTMLRVRVLVANVVFRQHIFRLLLITGPKNMSFVIILLFQRDVSC